MCVGYLKLSTKNTCDRFTNSYHILNTFKFREKSEIRKLVKTTYKNLQKAEMRRKSGNYPRKLEEIFKGIVSQDFEWLQMVLMDRLCVPDVPLEVYSFLNLHLHIAF